MYIRIYTHIYIYIDIYTENRTNGKRKFVLLGRQTINGNRRLLFQQTCPSTGVGGLL